MTDILESQNSPSPAATAVHDVTAAGEALTAAKRARSTESISPAELELQAAVDWARHLGVEWGQIGRALGIARGNAYQKYRTRPARGSRGNAPTSERSRSRRA